MNTKQLLMSMLKFSRPFVAPISKLFGKQFLFNEKQYNYVFDEYNNTWFSERAVEIPIALDFASKFKKNEILEIGNVLQHYGFSGHTIVDKYEKADNVINEDIVDYEPNRKFKAIISVSTFEHVGRDEGEDPYKAVDAIEKTKSFLSNDGEMLITIPLGWNIELDNNLEKLFDEIYYMKRVSWLNKWKQIPERPENVKYGKPYPFGNVIAICKFTKHNP